MTAAGGRLLCESEKSLACAAEPVQPVIRGPGAIFSALGARPGWPGVRPVANDGLSREVPVINVFPSDLHQGQGRLPRVFPRRAGRCLVSILINPEKMNSAVLDRSSQSGVSAAEEPRYSYRMRTLRREYEPLEEASEDCEAPERGAQLHLEAPDAGEPQFPHDDRELRHGRSRG